MNCSLQAKASLFVFLRAVAGSLLATSTQLFAAADASARFTVALPITGNTGGAVVIVSPADASPLARWLNGRGLATFTLPTAATAADATRAVQDLRAHAGDYHISPGRITLLGYAAGAEIAAAAAYNPPAEAKPDASDSVETISSRPNLVALIWGAAPPVPRAGGAKPPPTFLVGSTNIADNLSGTIDLWNKLRAARASVDAHFFAKADLQNVLATDNPSVSSWPEMFFTWARFSGLLTDEIRVPVKGMVYLDGHTLPHGYVIFTPIGFTGAGPIVGRVLNSTAGETIGSFKIPADQGPIPGRYKVEVYQTMNRWLSNSFSGDLVGGRGPATPEKAYFGHYRILAPSIDDVHVYNKARPADNSDYVIEFKAGAEANQDVKVEIFLK